MDTVTREAGQTGTGGELRAASTTRLIRLLVVDDHPAVQLGLRQLLDDQPDLEVVAVSGTAESAVGLAEQGRIDVAVVDYHLGGRAQPDLEVIAEAGNGAEAVDLALREDVDLAVIDISMPRMTGLQAARELRRRRPELRILILSMHENEQYLYEALKAGASGYVVKKAADRDLVKACRATVRGEPFPYPGAVSALVEDYLRRARGRGAA